MNISLCVEGVVGFGFPRGCVDIHIREGTESWEEMRGGGVKSILRRRDNRNIRVLRKRGCVRGGVFF